MVLLARNFRLHRWEGDLLFWHPTGRRLVLWEVRGRTRPGFAPSQVISPQKRENLRRLALWLVQRSGRTVATQLFEVILEQGRPRWRLFDIYWD
ncbi:YraN family protein [bacterium]|nr:YraN family protein [bacterium]